MKKKLSKAKKFFAEQGFMDFTRFCKIMDGCGLTLAEKIELYITTF